MAHHRTDIAAPNCYAGARAHKAEGLFAMHDGVNRELRSRLRFGETQPLQPHTSVGGARTPCLGGRNHTTRDTEPGRPPTEPGKLCRPAGRPSRNTSVALTCCADQPRTIGVACDLVFVRGAAGRGSGRGSSRRCSANLCRPRATTANFVSAVLAEHSRAAGLTSGMARLATTPLKTGTSYRRSTD